MALQVFDLCQNAVEIYRSSKIEHRRLLLAAIFSNRALGQLSACLERRSPFRQMTEWASLNNGRRNCLDFERPGTLEAWVEPFLTRIDPQLLSLNELVSAA